MPTQPTQPTLFESDPQSPATPAAAPETPGSVPDDDTPADAGDDGASDRQPSLLPDNPPPSVAQLRERRPLWARLLRSEEHTSELQSLMRISYAVFCLKKKKEPTYTYP